ncbi:DsbC family protein [Acinetobacter junii]|nr:DsbC family protein [Acinetobacter junii]ENV52077.1 hypothetical protein F953_00489 [Acinetobacter junii CIP 107470 = MTCC 11364]
MKSKDMIKICNDTIFMQFLSTGETKTSNIISLKDNAKFYLTDKKIITFSDGIENVIEEFSSDALAKTAYDALQEQLQKHYKYHSLFNKYKGALKWVCLPILITLFLLAFNGIVASALGNAKPSANSTQYATPGTIAAPLAEQLQLPPAQPTNASAQPGQTAEQAAELSKGLADGVAAGKFSVQLSSGSKGTLYVFSDPLCPHCQSIEPELEKLKDYTVHVFPVTIIGKTSSAPLVSKVLCLPAQKRAEAWKKVISGEDISTESCEAGNRAFGANDQIFRSMGFPGTPQLISGSGTTPDESVDFTAAAIGNWLSNH